MAFADLLKQAATIEHRAITSRNDKGNEVLTTSGTTDTLVYAEQTAATEVIVDRQTYQSDWLVALFPDVTIGPSDLVHVDGHDLEVLGPPAMLRNPRLNIDHHIEARCRESAG